MEQHGPQVILGAEVRGDEIRIDEKARRIIAEGHGQGRNFRRVHEAGD